MPSSGGACAGRRVAAAPSVTRRPPRGRAGGVEREAVLADLDLGAVAEGGLDARVEVGAVQRVEVAHLERRAVPHELGVLARDRDVVEEDVGVGVTADGRDIRVEQEPGAGVRPAAHDQQRRAGRQGGDGLLLGGADVGVERAQLGGRLG